MSNVIQDFLKIINIKMTDEILGCNNKYNLSISDRFSKERNYVQSNRAEIMIFFGSLYLIGILKSGHA